mmetsp:Transcript_29288/g.53048  ORF Transcript_29288/g.53048 Transcript_29288/m.53048 type:complete len:339 (-) Transcript_29288:252-1268(-)
MFGLAEQVHGHPVWRRGAVGNHEDLARAGDHVDADLAEHMLLGRGHIRIARAGDLVDARDACRAIGQCGHGLGAADREHPVHAGHRGRGQHQRVAHAVGRGHHHDDLGHAGDLGRDGIHQHAARVGGLAARHIDADTVQRRDLLAEQVAVLVAVAPAAARGLQLTLVIGPHAPRRRLQRVALHGRDGRQRGLQFGRGDFQRGHAGGVQPVEALGVVQHGGITAGPHIGQDLGDAALYGGVGLGRPMAQALELGVEVGGGGRELADQGHVETALAKASISGRRVSRLSFSAAWLTTRRDEMSMICSTSTSLLARSVPPVETRSTMASARPVSGASSIEP